MVGTVYAALSSCGNAFAMTALVKVTVPTLVRSWDRTFIVVAAGG